LKLEAGFVRSAAGASELPRDGLAEIALVGRSNVGKSSLINSLVRQRIARTSAAPGKTRLANLYRVARGSREPIYFVDLPGFGYARGDRDELKMVTRVFFGRDRQDVAALLLVDSRHPGLENDMEAWDWLQSTVERCGIVATKIDKLARGQRIRAMREFESVFEHPVLPVSAVTGEGLDELWTLIDKLTNSSRRLNPPHNSRPNRLPKGTAAPLPRRAREPQRK
jgi:GTP-binding protein